MALREIPRAALCLDLDVHLLRTVYHFALSDFVWYLAVTKVNNRHRISLFITIAVLVSLGAYRSSSTIMFWVKHSWTRL